MILLSLTFIIAIYFGLMGHSTIIGSFSNILWFLFFVLPSFLLFKLIFSKSIKHKLAVFAYSVLIFIFCFLTTRFCIISYMSQFTQQKWLNRPPELRYLMFNDLDKKYTFIGMHLDEVINVLGTPDYSYDDDNSICYKIEKIGFAVNDYFCLFYDENGKIIDRSHNN